MELETAVKADGPAAWSAAPAAPARAPSRAAAWARRGEELVLRAFDVAAASLLLLVCAPVMLAAAVLIKLDSPGPVLYAQVRVGLNRRRWGGAAAEDRRRRGGYGREFRVLKFRTMRVDAEADGKAVWCGRADPRVTRIGRALRRAHLDELPQLFNVLRGDMRLVGPRPERPEFVARLAEVVPGYEKRLCLKPGVTGLAQIRQTPDLEVDDVRRKVRYDLLYARRASLWTDLKISFWTVPLMLGLTAEHLRRSFWRVRFSGAARTFASLAAAGFLSWRGRS
jgi:lipopolysaccharide/colanic/teichoic acid biosynthesis glycosyltransferase